MAAIFSIPILCPHLLALASLDLTRRRLFSRTHPPRSFRCPAAAGGVAQAPPVLGKPNSLADVAQMAVAQMAGCGAEPGSIEALDPPTDRCTVSAALHSAARAAHSHRGPPRATMGRVARTGVCHDQRPPPLPVLSGPFASFHGLSYTCGYSRSIEASGGALEVSKSTSQADQVGEMVQRATEPRSTVRRSTLRRSTFLFDLSLDSSSTEKSRARMFKGHRPLGRQGPTSPRSRRISPDLAAISPRSRHDFACSTYLPWRLHLQ